MNTAKTVWIDLDNSPHVPLFLPIKEELEKRGCKVIVTARDFAQTVSLLKRTHIQYTVIGRHYGKNKLLKIGGLAVRAAQLMSFIRGQKVDFAVNHGSRTQVLACRMLNIPVYVGADYEHTESHIFSRLSTKMWIPEGVSEQGLKDFGIRQEKLIRYKGYKEELYLNNFSPDSEFKSRHSIPGDKILVTLRPPASQANYHNENSEKILSELIRHLKADNSIFVLCTPRTPDQEKQLSAFESDSFRVLRKVVDGLNLVYHSDVVISGGGTMNREAALLGTPVYSIFSGTLGSLDAQMEENGMIRFIRTPEDVKTIDLSAKLNRQNTYKINTKLVEFLVDSFLS